jgi:phosphatidylglycerophosphatase C
LKLQEYAFFDVDGTVISKDSFRLILKEGLRLQPWRVLLLALFLPVFFVTVLLRLDKKYAKSCTLWSLTVFKSRKEAIQFLDKVVDSWIDKIWFQEVNDEIAELRKQGYGICFVSASGQFWVRKMVAAKVSVPFVIIGSKLGFFAGGIIFRSKNCYEIEKLHRIHERLGHDLLWRHGYSDHPADIPMLDRCEKRHLISPTPHHLEQFEKRFTGHYQVRNWQAK